MNEQHKCKECGKELTFEETKCCGFCQEYFCPACLYNLSDDEEIIRPCCGDCLHYG